MKKWILLLLVLLTGCGQQPTMETIADEQLQPAAATARQVLVELPQQADVQAMQTAGEQLYICEDCTVTVQTMQGGDLDGTLRSVCGFGKDSLQLIRSGTGDYKRYEWVWTAAGEGEQLVGRGCLVDDGNFHYVLTVMAPESRMPELTEQIREITGSFRVVDSDVILNTGS